MAIDTVPVRIEPAAVERIVELGLQSDIDRVVAMAKELISNLHSIEVKIWTDWEDGMKVNLHLIAWKENYVRRDPEHKAWERRIAETMPLQFRQWVVCSMYPREAAANGR